MSKTNSFENQFLLHVFNNSAIANIGDASGLPAAAAAGNLYLRLCTDAVVVADGTIGTEASYTGYVAGGVAVPRSGAGFTVTAAQAVNAAEVTFGEATAGSETIRYVEVWKNNLSSSDSERLFWTQLNSDITIAVGVQPKFNAGALIFNED